MNRRQFSGAALRAELVRHITQALSSHDTPCRKFRLEDCAIRIAPDFTRHCPVVDADAPVHLERAVTSNHVTLRLLTAWLQVERATECGVQGNIAQWHDKACAFVMQPVVAVVLRPQFSSFLDLCVQRSDLVVGFAQSPEIKARGRGIRFMMRRRRQVIVLPGLGIIWAVLAGLLSRSAPRVLPGVRREFVR